MAAKESLLKSVFVRTESAQDTNQSYVAPRAEIVQAKNIDRASLCACKAGEDNPY